MPTVNEKPWGRRGNATCSPEQLKTRFPCHVLRRHTSLPDYKASEMLNNLWRITTQRASPLARLSSRGYHPLASSWSPPTSNLVPIVIEQTVGQPPFLPFHASLTYFPSCSHRVAVNVRMISSRDFCASVSLCCMDP